MLKGVVLPKSEREQLSQLIRDVGEKAARAHFEVAAATLARAVGGLGVNRSTAKALRAGLLTPPAPVV